MSRNQTVQGRLEGIDALELHFYGLSQHLNWATAARDHLLNVLGVPLASPPAEGVPAWALTRSADIYGRCIAFLIRDGVDLQDGARFMLGSDALLELIAGSANHEMLLAGHAFPLFYEFLPDSFQKILAEAHLDAKANSRGCLPEDKTLSGARFLTSEDVEEAVFNPKVARRLFRWFGTRPQGHRGLQGLRNFLMTESDPLHLLADIHPGNGHPPNRFLHDPDILEIDEFKSTLRLLVPPEQLIFHEKDRANPFFPG